MTPLERLALTLSIIFVCPALGYALKRASERSPRLPLFLDVWRPRLQSLAIFILMPFSATLSLWGLPRPDASLFLLPLMGLLAYVWGGALAVLCARALGMDAASTGAFYCCGTFSNIGAVGGLICLIFLGENAIALVALYRVLEEVFYFGAAFPAAASWAKKNGGAQGKANFRRVYPALAAIVCALACGVWLNFAAFPRPGCLGPVASGSMLCATVILLIAIGHTLRFSSVWGFRRAALAMCLIKFGGVPLVVTSAAGFLGFGAYDNGIILKTVAVLSAMPVAMTALVPLALFNLNLDLANACWLATTLALFPALPALVWLMPHL